MIKIITEKENHYCDICERRTQATNIQYCVCCNKELCPYCRIALMRVKRKIPNCGYLIKNVKIGNLCVECVEKKLKLKVEKLDYPKR